MYHDIDVISSHCLSAAHGLHLPSSTVYRYDPDPFSHPSRKLLTFQDLGTHLEKLLSEDEPAVDSTGQTELHLIYNSVCPRLSRVSNVPCLVSSCLFWCPVLQ